MPRPPEGYKVIATSVPQHIHEAIKARAAEQGITIDAWLRARAMNALQRTTVVRQDDAEDATVLDEDIAILRASFVVLPSTERTPAGARTKRGRDGRGTPDGHGL